MDRPPNDKIHWLPEEEYKKAIGQFRLQLNGVFAPFNLYGLGVFIDSAIAETVKLTEDFGLRVRGIDKTISLESVRNGNGGNGAWKEKRNNRNGE